MKREAAGTELVLHTEDFDYDECLTYLNRSPNELLHRVDMHQRTVTKVIVTDSGPVLVRLRYRDGRLAVAFPEGDPGRQVREAAAGYVAEWLDLGRDLQPFYAMAAGDPILRGIVPLYKGLRIVGVPDLFEALIWSIVGQQISLHVAYLLKQRFVEAFGESMESEGRLYWRFPEARRVADAEVDDLLQLKFSRKKAEYVIGVARLMEEGLLTKENLAACGDLPGMEKRLTSIRGIGSWSANYAIMRCLRHPDAFPAADAGLHNALKQALQLDRKPAVTEIVEWAKDWAGWRSYAVFYLWRSLMRPAQAAES